MEYSKNKTGLLVGMLLGDAYISKDGRLGIGHSIKQKDYLLFKKDRLKYFFNFTYTERYCGENKKYLECFIRSNTTPYLKLMRKIWYKPNKVLSKKMIYKISEEGLAYWYLDDGSLIFQRNSEGNIDSRRGYLNTQGFSFEENIMLQEMLEKKYNIKTKIHKERKYYKLYLNSTELKKLLNIISKYIPLSMKYKECFRYQNRKQKNNLCQKACDINNCPFFINN